MNQTEGVRAPISVIIPIYNCEQYIEEAVQSIIAQPLEVEHIVLINDGSTDYSGKICDELAYKYSHVHVQHQTNSGVSVARNNGIEWVLNNTNSTYLMFLDADDIWFKNWLKEDILPQLEGQFDVVAFDLCSADKYLKEEVLLVTCLLESFLAVIRPSAQIISPFGPLRIVVLFSENMLFVFTVGNDYMRILSLCMKFEALQMSVALQRI